MDTNEIEIREIYNAYCCKWRNVGQKEWNYDMDAVVYDRPISWELSHLTIPLEVGDGSAVSNILDMGIGKIVSTSAGGYGGINRTLRVDWRELVSATLKTKQTRLGRMSRTDTYQIWDDENDRVITDLDFV